MRLNPIVFLDFDGFINTRFYYHKDGKLPALNDTNCYNAKDLLVHPATVQAIAQLGIESDEQRQAAELEIMEVLGHFSQVESALQR